MTKHRHLSRESWINQPGLEHSQIKGVHPDGWGLRAQSSWVRLRDSSGWMVPTRVPDLTMSLAIYCGSSLVAQTVNNLPAMWETWVHSLGWEDTLVKEMADNPFQYSCLEKPMDRGAWWTTIHKVPKSQTQLSNWAHDIEGSRSLICMESLFTTVCILMWRMGKLSEIKHIIEAK